MGAICVSASSNYLSIYSLKSFCLFLWQNACLKQGKVLVPYTLSYFDNIKFKVDHIGTIKGPSFVNLMVEWGLKERHHGLEGYHHGSYMSFCCK